MTNNTTKNNTKQLILTNVVLTTADYKESGKFEREIKRKTTYIIPSDAETAKKMIDFGLTQYTTKDNKINIFIVPFSNECMYYDEQKKYRTPIIFDNTKPNFKVENATINIIQGISIEKQVFNRVNALRVKSADTIEVFKKDYFKDDDEFITVTNEEIEDFLQKPLALDVDYETGEIK